MKRLKEREERGILAINVRKSCPNDLDEICLFTYTGLMTPTEVDGGGSKFDRGGVEIAHF